MSTDPESKPAASAAERLALSRERIRQSMRATMPSSAATRDLGEPPSWLAGLTNIPAVAVVLDAVRSWWAQHPMRMATLVATDTAKTFIGPVAQRHPIGLVVGALLVGAVLARFRPVRRLIKPALFAGLLPQIISKVVAHVPVESWLSALSSLTTPSPPGPRESEAAAPTAQAKAAKAADAPKPAASAVDTATSASAPTDPGTLH